MLPNQIGRFEQRVVAFELGRPRLRAVKRAASVGIAA
jgi:hypothetical protein